MSITVTRTEHTECESQVEAHRDLIPEAELCIAIGTHESVHLCIDCARKLFNLVGFMVMNATGESLQQLVGLTKKRRSP